MQELFTITKATHPIRPIVLSIPHSGTLIPDDLKNKYKPELLPPDDTDWWVNRLYDFAPAMGITVIKANYSRWVIDLNRNHDSQPLYNDGRLITGLCPTTNFLGEPIYNDERTIAASEEINRRKEEYFIPYHQKLQTLLDETKETFGKVLLWDCHSIRRHVLAISKAPLSDLILGSADETSADISIIDAALQLLRSGKYGVHHNYLFKGGYITRHFGKPHLQQHALQLEMAKPLYLNDTETIYDEQRAAQIQEILYRTFEGLTEHLNRI
jgi:N-formylglutamate deformylase